MTDDLPETLKPYPGISSKAYEHPADRAATAALKAVPMLDTLVRKLIEWRYERAVRQQFLGTSLKVGENQLPDLFAAHQGACTMLDLPSSYDLYVAPNVGGLGVVIGSKNPMIVLDSDLVGKIGSGEKRALIGHELGHVLSDHMVYVTALQILLRVGSSAGMFFALPFMALRAVLLEWYRATELSCDRAAVLTVRDPQIVCRLLMVTASGIPAEQLNLDAFMAQAMAYESWDDPSDRVRRFFHEINVGHPYAVRRVSEIMKWVQSGEFDRIQRGEYRRRDEKANVREEAGDAAEFYAERFRSMFSEFGENVTKLGAQVGGLAEQAADWLRARGAPAPGGGSRGAAEHDAEIDVE